MTPPKTAPDWDERAREIAAEAVKAFNTFGAGSKPVPGNPISVWMAERPAMFAMGVSVEEVVRFVLDRAHAAGLSERDDGPHIKGERCASCDQSVMADWTVCPYCGAECRVDDTPIDPDAGLCEGGVFQTWGPCKVCGATMDDGCRRPLPAPPDMKDKQA